MCARTRLVTLALLPLAGCAGITTPIITSSTVFEVEYVNFAWVPTWRGFAIDSTGTISRYDLRGQPWQPKDEELPTRAELAAKHHTNAVPVGSVGDAELQAMQERAGPAAAGPLSAPQYGCADAGTVTYSVYLLDAGRGGYRRVVLRREGDIAQLNQSAPGRALADWLRTLQLLPTIDGCQPS